MKSLSTWQVKYRIGKRFLNWGSILGSNGKKSGALGVTKFLSSGTTMNSSLYKAQFSLLNAFLF